MGAIVRNGSKADVPLRAIRAQQTLVLRRIDQFFRSPGNFGWTGLELSRLRNGVRYDDPAVGFAWLCNLDPARAVRDRRSVSDNTPNIGAASRVRAAANSKNGSLLRLARFVNIIEQEPR